MLPKGPPIQLPPRLERVLWYGPWLILASAILITGWLGVRDHWVPVGDNAMIATFSLDTLSADPPTLGMPTSLSLRTGAPVRHPGPLPFWLIGPAAKLLGAPGYGVVVGVVAIHVAGLAAMVVSTRRLPWSVGPFAAAFASLMTARHMGFLIFRSPFNPYLGIFSAVASFLAAWSVLSGHLWILPVFVAVASFVAQTHVTYLPLIGALVAVVVAALVIDHRRLPSDHPRRRLLLRRVAPVSVLVGLACWSGPLYDQFFGTGNLWALIAGGGSVDPAGWQHGWNRLVRGIIPIPYWAQPWMPGPQPEPVSIIQSGTAVALLGLLALQGAWAWRTRHRPLVAAVTVTVTVLAASTLISSRIPGDDRALLSPLNRMFWTPVGCMTWLVLGWGTWTVVRATLARHRPTIIDRLPLAATGAIAALVICVITVGRGLDGPAAQPTQDRGSILFGAAHVHGDAIEEMVPAGATILVRSPGTDIDNLTFTQTMIAQLRLRGYGVHLEPVDPWGHWRAYRSTHPADGSHDVTIELHGVPADPPPAGFDLLSRYNPQRPPAAFVDHRVHMVRGAGRQTSEVYVLSDDATDAGRP